MRLSFFKLFLQVSKSKDKTISQRPSSSGVSPAPPVLYGPIFGCSCCHGLHFLSSVVELETVEALRSREARARFLDLPYVARNAALFRQLDKYWLCRRCRENVAKNSMPPLSAKNMLGATWALVPRRLRRLSQLELEMVSLDRVSVY